MLVLLRCDMFVKKQSFRFTTRLTKMYELSYTYIKEADMVNITAIILNRIYKFSKRSIYRMCETGELGIR